MKLLDWYFRKPLLKDFIAVSLLVVVYGALMHFRGVVISVNQQDLQNLVNTLISSSVSIGGFIIAALTIIVTFKENLKAKDMNKCNAVPAPQNIPAIDATLNSAKNANGLDLLFKSHHYKTVVGVFYWAALIFIGTFIYFCGIDVFWPFLKNHTQYCLVGIFYGISLIGLAVFRCLWVLRKVINLQTEDLISHA